MLFSFSAGRNASSFEGFSTQWYGRAFNNPFVLDALGTSLTVAFATAVMACLFGTMAALALQNVKGRMRVLFDAMIYIAIMVPGIVIGIATLDRARHRLRPRQPGVAGDLAAARRRRGSHMGFASLIAAHTLFTMALVIVIVRARIAGMDRALIEASSRTSTRRPGRPSGRSPCRSSCRRSSPGFLLSFTFSFDDFIIAFFVAGSETTLPIYIFSSIRRGVTPEINAIGTAVLAGSLTLLVVAQLLMRRRARRAST